MKRSLLRIVMVLAALMVVSAVLPVYAEYDSYGLPSYEYSLPWWEINPPQVRTRTRTVTRSAETVVESIDAEGYCYTAIKRVNVRSRPSVSTISPYRYSAPEPMTSRSGVTSSPRLRRR